MAEEMSVMEQIARACEIKPNSMDSKEAAEAIMAEPDKRLMPPGMEWPRFEDGGTLNRMDRFVYKDGEHVCAGWQIDDHGIIRVRLMWDDERPSNTYMYLSPGERVKRPEPKMLGAKVEPACAVCPASNKRPLLQACAGCSAGADDLRGGWIDD